MEHASDRLLTLAAQIISAHVEHNETETSALPSLIREVYATLAAVDAGVDEGVGQGAAALEPRRKAQRAMGVAPDLLVCMECSMSMKMLKRHLITVHDLTPEEYREKHGLAADYPMVASDYAALRSKLAKASGLGKRPANLGVRGRNRGR